MNSKKSSGFISALLSRPVLLLSIFIISLLGGLLSFNSLCMEESPQIRTNLIVVRLTYSSSIEHVQHLSNPLEKALTSLPNIVHTEASISSAGVTYFLSFSENSDWHKNMVAIQEAIATTKNELPNSSRVNISSDDDRAKSVMTIGFVSRGIMTDKEIAKLVSELKYNFENVSGVSAVNVDKDEDDSVTWCLRSCDMSKRCVDINQITNTISNLNVDRGVCDVSSIKSSNESMKVDVGLDSIGHEDPMSFPIYGGPESRNLVLGDIIHPLPDHMKTKTTISKVNGKEAVTMSISKMEDANLIEVCQKLRHKVAEIKPIFDKREVDVVVTEDKSLFVKSGIKSIKWALVKTIILVTAIIIFVLQSFRLAIIPLVALLSALPTFSVMYVTGISINIFSLIGFLLATGLVTDDAIIALENIYKYVEKGYTKRDAIKKGASEMVMPIIYLTLTNVVASAPVILSTNPMIRAFRDFSAVIAVSVLFSGLISIFLTPIMFDYIYVHNNKHTLHDYEKDRMSKYYAVALMYLMSHRRAFLGIVYYIVACSLIFMLCIAKFEENIDVDRGQINYSVSSKQDKNLDAKYIDEKLSAITDKVCASSVGTDILNVISYVDTNKGHSGLSLTLRPHAERKFNIKQISKEIERMASEETSDIYLVADTAGGQSNHIELVLQSHSEDITDLQLQGYCNSFCNSNKCARVINAAKTLFLDTKEIPRKKIVINKQTCQLLCVSPADIANTLGQINQNRFFKQPVFKDINKIFITVEQTGPKYTLEEILNIPVKALLPVGANNKQEHVPIRNFVRVIEDKQRIRRTRFMNNPGTKLWVELNSGQSIRDLVACINEFNAKHVGEVKISVNENTMKKVKATQQLGFMFGLATLFIYLFICGLVESFIIPIIMVATIPITVLCSMSMLLIAGYNLNLVVIIGQITLIGLVSKHVILLLYSLSQEINNKLVPVDEIITLCSVKRLRPILMTTLCMAVEAIPLCFSGKTEFREYKIPLGICMLSLIFTTALIIFVIPTLYLEIQSTIYGKHVVTRCSVQDTVNNKIVPALNSDITKKEDKDDGEF